MKGIFFFLGFINQLGNNFTRARYDWNVKDWLTWPADRGNALPGCHEILIKSSPEHPFFDGEK